MKGFNDFFAPCGDSVAAPSELRELIGMRSATVAQYGLFAPDAVYPVYQCPQCKSQEVSLSLLAPELTYYEDFESFVNNVNKMVGALPLAPCKGCGSSNPSEPTWVGFFTYLVQAKADLFLRIEGNKVEDAFKVPLVGDPEQLGPMSDDGRFLEVFDFPFCHRWAWRSLVDMFMGVEGLHVKKIDDGLFFGVDGTGSTTDEKWQGWFAAHSKEEELDSLSLMSPATEEEFSGGGPAQWLSEAAARRYANNSLKLITFYSVERFRRLVEATLLQRGIKLQGELDPFIISLDEYSCAISLASIIRAATYTAYPVDRVLRHHLLGRLEYLEAVRGVGRRLTEVFEEQYLVSIAEGNIMEVRNPDDQKLLRTIELGDYSDFSVATTEEFHSLLSDEFGFDTEKETFVEGH